MRAGSTTLAWWEDGFRGGRQGSPNSHGRACVPQGVATHSQLQPVGGVAARQLNDGVVLVVGVEVQPMEAEPQVVADKRIKRCGVIAHGADKRHAVLPSRREFDRDTPGHPNGSGSRRAAVRSTMLLPRSPFRSHPAPPRCHAGPHTSVNEVPRRVFVRVNNGPFLFSIVWYLQCEQCP